MTQPTGVFVRLPLSDEQRELMVDAAAFGRPDDSHDKALLTIGSPVTGGELEVVGMRTRDMRSIATSAWHYSGDVESDTSTYEAQFLVRQSDALAKLAEKDAEIVRIREETEALRMAVNAQKRFLEVLMEVSLKGPEA